MSFATILLAESKRVLVTSMKDPALREFRRNFLTKLGRLQFLSLSSEQEGMKQFEHAIERDSMCLVDRDDSPNS